MQFPQSRTAVSSASPKANPLRFYSSPALLGIVRFLICFFLISIPPRYAKARNFRQNRVAAQTNLDDPRAECAPYYYGPVNTRLSSFPPIWGPATVLSGDTIAEAKWESIQPSVPDIPPKGTPSGNFDDLVYSSRDDDCWWTYSKCVTPVLAGLPPDIADIPEPRTLAYGFDDGPNCSHNAFYDYLLEQNQRATMFYIGSNVMDWPLETQRAVSDGHEICVHTWSHRYMTALSSRDAFAELYYTMQAIKLVADVTPTCWRPPYGDVDDRIRAIANGLGLTTVLWRYDSNDWRVGAPGGVSPDAVDANYEAFLSEAEKGTFDQIGPILLAHELNNFTMAEAVKYHQQLKAAFDNVVPLAIALNKTQPYVETHITMPNFDDYLSSITAASNAASSDGSPDRSADPTESVPKDGTDGDAGRTINGTGQAGGVPNAAQVNYQGSEKWGNGGETGLVNVVCVALVLGWLLGLEP